MRKNLLTLFLILLTVAVFSRPVLAHPEDCQNDQPCHDGGLTDKEVISAEALRDKILHGEKFVLFDARSKRSYEQAHISGAILPLTEEYYRKEDLFAKGKIARLPDRGKALAQALRRYPKDTEIVTYCGDQCQASAVLLFEIKKLDFKNVRAMTPGFQSWTEKGYPVVEKR